MEHRPGVQQLKIGLHAAELPLQHAKQVHPSRVVEQQIILGVMDVLGDLPDKWGIGDLDSSDLGHGMPFI
ncbi:Uncharacterised protein [Mycobacteroides abscessus subsp. abscessus]|nr:Uncharacterised protein [Mycobacteroides abscessus subsp. abscessus]